jgi:cell division protein FtsL
MNRLVTLLLICLSFTVYAQQAATPKSESEFYRMMYEQAKGEADRAHNDIWYGYAINTSIILAVALLVLAVQVFNTKRELRRMRERINSDMNTMQTAVLAQLSRPLKIWLGRQKMGLLQK